MVNDVLGIFTSSQLAKDTFSTKGLRSLASIKFWEYVILYELALITLFYLYIFIKAKGKDKLFLAQ